jgi:hypothetical protein
MSIAEELVLLSRELGREDRQLAILGEGNTAADLGDGTFPVTASIYYRSSIATPVSSWRAPCETDWKGSAPPTAIRRKSS